MAPPTEAVQGHTLQDLLDGRLPDDRGRFGDFGGRFVPETLMPAITHLERGAREALADPEFLRELESQLKHWVGRPTPLSKADGLADAWNAAEVWLKREDLTHTGAHKINNGLGQALLAQRLGATRVVAETGAGQHGVAAAAGCARVGLPCTVYMGEIDVARQAPNVQRMRMLGAEVVSVTTGDRTLRAAIDEALRDWVRDPEGTYYLIGSVVGPHPYPWLVRELQTVVGKEARAQVIERAQALPDLVAACVGGGSNAIGLFHGFLADADVQILGLEAGGTSTRIGHNAATIVNGRPGVLHGAHTTLIQTDDGQIIDTESISAGLDYPGVGPEHAFLHSVGRVEYSAVSDAEALAAVDECCLREGILPALESAHALAGARAWSLDNPGSRILIGLSGRGDKDLATLIERSDTSSDTQAGADV